MKTTASLLSVLLLAIAVAGCNTATHPAPKGAAWWDVRHEDFLATVQKNPGCQLLFLGDSITDYWRAKGKGLQIWNAEYAPRNAVNLGIAGDRTEHLLWRLQNGELGSLRPKAVVLMIGTNNTGYEADGKTPRNSTKEIAAGVSAIVKYLREKLPASKILLLAVFPRAEKNSEPRVQVGEVNKLIASLHDGQNIFYLDIGPKFLEPDGTLSRDIMPDLLHPNERGYQIWADAIREPLAGLLK
ncbi:MAG: GDSL-type esterase/lipase family protein [Opitutaceae bacterium]|jgi:lysophospholipase L1-like esterase|nr:GDSL-type esterase/lipase family protein [Opitutaceae bacterium]